MLQKVFVCLYVCCYTSLQSVKNSVSYPAMQCYFSTASCLYLYLYHLRYTSKCVCVCVCVCVCGCAVLGSVCLCLCVWSCVGILFSPDPFASLAFSEPVFFFSFFLF